MSTRVLERNIDYLNSDFTIIEEGLNDVSNTNEIRIEINEGLEEALNELQNLQTQLPTVQAGNLLELCKNSVIEGLTNNLGLIGLFMTVKDGGSVTTLHNFEKGVTSTDKDQQRYDGINYYDRKAQGYDEGFSDKRKRDFQNNDKIIDYTTGEELPKDETAHIDHIVSAKEVETTAANNLFLTPEERAKMATSPENTAYIKSNANESKGEKPMKEWLDTKVTVKQEDGSTKTITNAEHYGIDREKALAADEKARQYMKKCQTNAAAKKYTKELLVTGGKDAAMQAGFSVFGAVLRDFTIALFEEVKMTFKLRGQESLKDVFVRFKTRMGEVAEEIKKKWKSIAEDGIWAGITAFLSNILVFVINLFATTLKKIVYMIRAGFVSIVQAVRILANPPVGMPAEEVRYQALKVLVTGLIAAGSLGLSAAIEKCLQAIPCPPFQAIMAFPIPDLFGRSLTISDFVATLLSGIVGGLISTIVVYYMDKFRQKSKEEKIKFQLVTQSGVVVQYKIAQTWLVLDGAQKYMDNLHNEDIETLKWTAEEIAESGRKADEAISSFKDTVSRFKQLMKGTGEVK